MDSVPDPYYEIYTDGACHAKSRVGGWGFIIIEKPVERYWVVSGTQERTTNNRMELMAAIAALKNLEILPKHPTILYSDSSYLVKGMNVYLSRWIDKQWHGVKNVDLWQVLLGYKTVLPMVEFRWVRGHDGNEWNNLADWLSVKASDGLSFLS